MNSNQIQKEFFRTGATRPVEYRVRQLRSLYRIITIYQDKISAALYADLGKSPGEAYASEIGLVLHEISYTLKHLRRWNRPKRVRGSLSQMGSHCRILPEPYGVCLIIAPWNYPFLLAIMPAVSAIAAGNCVVIKPSEYAPATSQLLSEIFNQNFEQRFCRVVQGGEETAKGLLMQKFDYIFYTGSTKVGRSVMAQAAQNLTPVTLELGGKSPCIVDGTAHLDLAARRIVWGKLLNCGQTCVAPDYLLVHRSVTDLLVDEIKLALKRFYGENPLLCEEYPRIINQKHFERLTGLLEGLSPEQILIGGTTDPDSLKIAPTLVLNPPAGHPLTQEEIFGPILPIIEYDRLEEVVENLREQPRPLALYLFTRNSMAVDLVFQSLSFGGGCVNDTVAHLLGEQLPFGGVGESGMGSYHGKAGFDTFSHKKSVLKASNYLELSLRYPPFRKKLSYLRWLLK